LPLLGAHKSAAHPQFSAEEVQTPALAAKLIGARKAVNYRRSLLGKYGCIDRVPFDGRPVHAEGVGDSFHNVLASTINELYKAEVIHRKEPWRTMEAVECARLEWVGWYNNRRLLSSIGNVLPAGRSRPLRSPGGAREDCRLTQTIQPPAISGRFTVTVDRRSLLSGR
jgi:hypothetical protein